MGLITVMARLRNQLFWFAQSLPPVVIFGIAVKSRDCLGSEGWFLQ
ncbi:MAG: hypothetical protein WBA93_18650 [Microcoleaceae cyanobacterium]